MDVIKTLIFGGLLSIVDPDTRRTLLQETLEVQDMQEQVGAQDMLSNGTISMHNPRVGNQGKSSASKKGVVPHEVPTILCP